MSKKNNTIVTDLNLSITDIINRNCRISNKVDNKFKKINTEILRSNITKNNKKN